MEHWLKEQLNEAHKLLDDMGAPKSEIRKDWRHPKGENEFSLGVPERIQWLKRNWAPKVTPTTSTHAHRARRK